MITVLLKKGEDVKNKKEMLRNAQHMKAIQKTPSTIRWRRKELW